MTGASDGIGKGYATELARRGMNVVLVARNRAKLDAVRAEIGERALLCIIDDELCAAAAAVAPPAVELRTCVFDFTTAALADYEALIAAGGLAQLDVGVLVNNVGMAAAHPDYLCDTPAATMRDMIVVNNLAMVAMTRLLAPAMVARGRGAIVNVSSGGALTVSPLLSVYGASKTFTMYFSAALRQEYPQLTVQTLIPLYVATALSRIERPSRFAPDGSTYARSALRTLGVMPVSHGCWPHQLQVY